MEAYIVGIVDGAMLVVVHFGGETSSHLGEHGLHRGCGATGCNPASVELSSPDRGMCPLSYMSCLGL